LAGAGVLVLGGDQIGLQIADYLSEQGKSVQVVEQGAHFASKMAIMDRYYLIERITRKAVKRYKNVHQVDILPNEEVSLVSNRGRERLTDIDTIVLASHRRPNAFLAEMAERRGIETHIIGDASGVTTEDQGTIMNAIAAGYDVGRQV